MHLLPTEQATLDEAEVAVDLGQSAADIVVLSFNDSDLSCLAAAWNKHRDQLPGLRLASLKRLRHPMSVDLYVDQVIAGSRLVIIRSVGGLDYWRYGFDRVADVCRARGVMLAALSGDDRPDARLSRISTLPGKALERLYDYFREGGADNLLSALHYAAALLGAPDLSEPLRALGSAICVRTDGEIVDADDIAEGPADAPCALVTFYRANLLAADTAPIEEMLRALGRQGMKPLAVAVTSLKDPEAGDKVTALIAKLRPAVIINATAFSARRDDDTSVLDQADCPVLQVAFSGSTEDAWSASARGLSPTDLAMNVVLPELDGRIFTRAISFKAESAYYTNLQYASVLHRPAMDRISYVAALAAAWAQLAAKARAERRVALVLSDYPARGGRTGYACGLDTPESIRAIVSMLAAGGYDTGGVDWHSVDIIARLTERSPSESISVSIEQYRSWLLAQDPALTDSLFAAWGEPEDDPACSGRYYNFPCLRAGNVLVLLQPDRGSRGDRKQGYHDTGCPPRHSYAALYAALRGEERIDALVHLGTHGTLEWLPGKAVALSRACFPEALLGPMPLVYPFIVNNPGEAVQAKRRIAGVTIGHLTPPLSQAGLHGPMAELEGLIEEYADAQGADRRRVQLLEAEILERAWRSGLAKDCGVVAEDMPAEAIAKLDAQLCDIKDLSIRDRLHVFGHEPASNALADLVDATACGLGGSSDVDTSNVAHRYAACAGNERQALLAALDGRFVRPGPAGAPTRGRIDVLPTGRNLTVIDPRSIPTRTAATIGARAADEVVRRHLQDNGEYPRSVFLDLWASASLRTGGDDLAQALSYLGVRSVWDMGSNRVTGVEVIPHARLERPRIDVTLRVSGLFRDIFPAQIALFDIAVRRVAELDEDDDWNPLAAARRRGESLARVFGGAPGAYGAGTAETVLDTEWSRHDELAAAYLSAGAFAYGAQDQGARNPEAFAARVTAADVLIHPQDDRERDLLDGDGVADFVGGFAAAATSLNGAAPALYHLDTSRPDAPVVRTIGEEIVRIVRGRLTNPRWIAGMLEHGHRGCAEMAQSVDALYAFSAAAGVVPGHLVESVHDALVADVRVSDLILAANPDAMAAITERFQDLLTRGLWTSRRNAIHAELATVRLRAEEMRSVSREAAQ